MKSRYTWVFKKLLLLVLTVSFISPAMTQLLPGFDRNEYADILTLQFKGLSESDGANANFKLEKGMYKRHLLTPEVGLYNRAGLFLREDGVVVVKLRGTVGKAESWLENFYAGMVPARGTLELADDFSFSYTLSERQDAAVHVGWLIGTAYLAREILPVLDSMVNNGHKEMIIAGHSQGGALSFLMTAYLHYYFKEKGQKVTLKTYASAAPKPGNLSFAYSFDHITANGYAFRVVNADDWVPESPFSVQTLHDFNEANPLANAGTLMGKQPLLARIYLKSIYNKMNRRISKAEKSFRKNLGEKAYALVKKSLPQFEKPELSATFNYQPAGVPIVLMPNEAYHKLFPFDGKNTFVHHSYKAYTWLLDNQYPQ